MPRRPPGPVRTRLPSLLRAPSGRLTNLKLLLALAVTFATGIGSVATGSARGRWIVVAHGVAAMIVILLIPWKTRVVRAGLPHHRIARWPSLLLALFTVAALVFGLGYATGLLQSVGGVAGMWLHVAFALAVVPPLLWHVAVRRAPPRRTDLSRRTLLRAGVLGGLGGALYLATTVTVDLLDLPGTTRRFTGSYAAGSFTPAAMPNTIWLNDTAPVIDPASWRLTVTDAAGTYSLRLDQLTAAAQTRRVVLDCTSGWYAEQDWTGTPLSALVRSVGDARSIRVSSATGYWIRLPVADLDSLLLATHVGGASLSVGHGFPLRLVAPGRRGYWWVKWVDTIELQATPWWWQPPFPLT